MPRNAKRENVMRWTPCIVITSYENILSVAAYRPALQDLSVSRTQKLAASVCPMAQPPKTPRHRAIEASESGNMRKASIAVP